MSLLFASSNLSHLSSSWNLIFVPSLQPWHAASRFSLGRNDYFCFSVIWNRSSECLGFSLPHLVWGLLFSALALSPSQQGLDSIIWCSPPAREEEKDAFLHITLLYSTNAASPLWSKYLNLWLESIWDSNQNPFLNLLKWVLYRQLSPFSSRCNGK